MANHDIINLGLTPDSGTGDSARLGGTKINTLMADIYSQMGDLAIDTNNQSLTYGQRTYLQQYQYQVGELHPAGRYRRVVFYDDSDANLFNNASGWNDTLTTTIQGVKVPVIYTKKNWYFMNRGEAISADLINCTKPVNIVLPLGRAGDVIRIRDIFGTWSSTRTIRVWTTPYQFQTGTAYDSEIILNFFSNTPGFKQAGGTYEDSDIINAPQINNSTTPTPSNNASYKSWTTGAPYTFLSSSFGTPFTNSTAFTELEFVFLGPQRGWTVRAASLNPSASQATTINFSNFVSGSWVQLSNNNIVGTQADSTELVIPGGWYVLPVYYGASTAAGSKSDTAGAVFEVYRQVDNNSDTSPSLFLQQIITAANANPSATSVVAWYNTVTSTGPSQPIYKLVQIPSVADNFGNILLISEFPFDGRVKFISKAST